jgi:two-component system sensor histidine kinase TctE
MADRSLRLQLLAWLLIPLAGIVIVNTWITYRNARATAGIVTDRTLLASARSMAEQVELSNGVMDAIIPPSSLEMFASEAGDRVYYRIDDTAQGRGTRLIAGSPELPVAPEPPDDLSPRFFDAAFRGQLLHLVAIRQPVTGNPPRAAVIVVGQTTGYRVFCSRDCSSSSSGSSPGSACSAGCGRCCACGTRWSSVGRTTYGP